MFLFLTCSIPIFASTQIQDPYVWLEEMETSKALGWVATQNQQAQSYLMQIPERELIKEKLQKFSDHEIYGLPKQKESRLYFFRRDRGEELDHLAMQEPSGETHILVSSDPKAILSDFEVSEDGRYVTYGISDTGQDKQKWKFLNVETGEILPDCIDEIQFSSPVWSSDNEGVYYINYEELALYYHKLGTRKDECIFQLQGGKKKLLLGLAQPFENCLLFHVINRQSTGNAVYLLDVEKDKLKKLVPFDQGRYSYVGEKEGKLLFLTDDGANQNKLVAYEEGWSDLIPECEKTLIEVAVVNDTLICNYLEQCISVIERFDISGKFLDRVQLPGKGSVSIASETPFFSYSDMMTPKTIYHYDYGVYFKPSCGNLTSYVTDQHFFFSKDGTRVPLFITHQKGLELIGDHPTLLYGYGGFNIPITPTYSSLIATWLDMGGVFVSVNLRGGGEYGKKWYEAGILENKQNVFDDFIAAAEFLIESGYTHSGKLAINGRSNGGLLVGACLVQRPDLFAAAIPQVGVLDMLKFNHFTVGWTWMSDYGNPDNPYDFSYLSAYSPYHNVKEEVSYPPTLITTADHDDRVVPLHSYKFAARLQEAQEGQHPILLRTYSDTGHGVGRSLEQLSEENTDILSFLFHVLH